jgi:hypothetical protein
MMAENKKESWANNMSYFELNLYEITDLSLAVKLLELESLT